MKFLRISMTLVLGAAVCCLLVACGGSSSSTSSGSQTAASAGSSSTSTSSTASGTPITIGSIQDDLLLPSAESGLNVAVNGINSRGGIDGHKIKLDVCLTHNDPNAAGTCARKLVADPGVVALVGSWTVGGTVADPILNAAKIPSFNPTLLAPPDYASRTFFADNISGLSTNGTIAVAADVLGAKKTAFAVFGNAGGLGLAQTIDSGVLKPRGLPNAVLTPLPPTATDFTSEAAQIANAHVDVVVPSGQPNQNPSLLRSLKEQGVTLPAVFLLNGAGGGAFYAKTMLPYTKSLTITSPYRLTGPVYQQFLSDWKAAGRAPWTWDGTLLNNYVGVQLLAAVIKAGAPITRAGLLAGVQHLTWTAGGMVPPINFSSPVKVLSFTHMFNNSVSAYKQNTDGSLSPINGGAFVTVFK